MSNLVCSLKTGLSLTLSQQRFCRKKNHITTSDTKQVGARLEPLHFLAGKGASTTAAQQLHTLSVYELKLTNTQSVWDRHLPGKVV